MLKSDYLTYSNPITNISTLVLWMKGSGFALGSLSCQAVQQNTKLQQEVNTLQQQVRQLTAANQAIRQQLTAENQAIRQQLTDCTTSLSTNQQQLRQCNEQLNACNTQVTQLTSQLTTCQGELLSFTSVETEFQVCAPISGAISCTNQGCFLGCYPLALRTLYNIP
ncbi:unnamed protein product [Mytilus coruscus]|uniref:Uncharacterized protein n=1 Tax=Mytilus coruscus TaxID=42192 RepID=A0A6J8BQY0_MYTCO|nr:unnamed protein product [Mytilus coruscus]